MASKLLKAQLAIDEFRTIGMNKDELEEYVTQRLLREMHQELIKQMTIENINNPSTGVTTYTGSLNVGASTISAVSGFNGTTYNSYENQTELRVVEFVKNGKVTKVELQRYTEDGWRRIPRIQLEDNS